VASAGGGFLLAVLWFDLMFDVQARRRGDSDDLPEEALASIAAYYARVTTDASPMNRLVAAVMAATLGALGLQLAQGEVPRPVAGSSLALGGSAVGLAAKRTVPNAVRLGARSDPQTVQSRLARSIYHDHVLCASAISALLALQVSHVSKSTTT
jgi:hypothetical protein